MLADDVAEHAYGEAGHDRRFLQAMIGRPRGSIEYKHPTSAPCSRVWVRTGSPATEPFQFPGFARRCGGVGSIGASRS